MTNNKEIITQQTSEADPMLDMIDRVCTSPDFDINKMEKLVEMRNAELGRVASIDFNRDFAKMQEKLPRVVSTHRNDQTSSNYAKIEDINKICLPILAMYGFGISFKVIKQDKDGVTIRAILMHSGGHKENTDIAMPYDNKGIKGSINKTDVHAAASTITYAKRYAMCMLLNISTGDNDGNNQTESPYITSIQVEEIQKLMEESGIDKVKFISEFLKSDCIQKIPQAFYIKAINVLTKRKQENADS